MDDRQAPLDNRLHGRADYRTAGYGKDQTGAREVRGQIRLAISSGFISSRSGGVRPPEDRGVSAFFFERLESRR